MSPSMFLISNVFADLKLQLAHGEYVTVFHFLSKSLTAAARKGYLYCRISLTVWQRKMRTKNLGGTLHDTSTISADPTSVERRTLQSVYMFPSQFALVLKVQLRWVESLVVIETDRCCIKCRKSQISRTEHPIL